MGAVERLLHGDVHHGAGGTGAMPVFLARRNPHRVTGTDFADRAAPGLCAPEPRHHMQSLAARVGVPRSAGARLEAHARRPEATWSRRFDARSVPDGTGT